MPLLPEPLPAGPVRSRLPQPLLQLEAPAVSFQSSGLPRLKTALYRQRWLLATIVVFFLALAAALTWILPPHYVAEGSIIIEPPNQRLAELTPADSSMPFDEDRTLQTEMTILASRAVALPVIGQLHLDVRDVEIRTALANAETSARRKGQTVSPRLRDQIASDIFGHKLAVLPDKLSRTVHVEYTSRSPELSSEVVNATLQEFMGYGQQQRLRQAKQADPWLQQQLEEVNRRTLRDDQQLVDFQQRHAYTPLLLPGGQQNVLLARLADANHDLSTAEADQITSEALLHTYPGSLEELPASLRTPELDAAIAARATALTDLNRLSATYQAGFPLVVAARDQLAKAQQHLNQLRAQVTTGLEKQHQAALERQQDMQQLVDDLSHAAAGEGTVETRYELLKQQAAADQQLYQTLRQKLNQEQLMASLPTSNVRLLDPAERPMAPAYPRLPVDLGLGLVLGLVVGLGAALGRERWSDALTGVDQLRDGLGGGLTPLAVIPDQQRMLDHALRDLPPGEAASAGEEGYARMAAQLMARGRQLPLAVLLTSANPGDGKTMTTCRVGQALARAGWRTLVVDADLRRPGCHTFFGIENGSGLIAAQLGTEVAPVKVADGLDLMPCEASPSQPLQPRRIAALMERWRQQYDCILLDSPPGILTGEAVLLAPLVDGVVVVLRWGHTRAAEAQQLGDELARTGTPLFGSVLNRADPSAPVFRYYRRHYGYFNTPAVVR